MEVVSLLLEKGLIELVFTTDGKEYLTNDQLKRELEDELYVHGVSLKKSFNSTISLKNYSFYSASILSMPQKS